MQCTYLQVMSNDHNCFSEWIVLGGEYDPCQLSGSYTELQSVQQGVQLVSLSHERRSWLQNMGLLNPDHPGGLGVHTSLSW